MRLPRFFHRDVETPEKSFAWDLTYFQMVRRFLKASFRAGDSQSGLKYSKDRSYSEAPYEHRVIICRASRGIAKNWRLRPALDAGFCILWALFSSSGR